MLKTKQVDVINALEAGACNDGENDATNAFQLALNRAAQTNQTMFVPAGTYLLSKPLAVSGNVSMFGESRGSTRLLWKSGEGLHVTLNLDAGFSQTCDIENLSLLTRGCSGAALTVVGSPYTAPDRVTARVVLRDLIVRGDTNPTVDGWNIGIRLTNCSNSFIQSVSLIGKVGVAEPVYDTDSGIVYDNANAAYPHPAAITISDSFITYAKTAIYCSDFEGALITANQIVGVNTGVHVSGPLNYPHASILNNHINASALCVLIDRMHEVSVHGNLLYKQLGDTTTGTGIDVLNGAGYFSIMGNTFENLSGCVGLNGVIVSNGQRGIVTNNIFRRCDCTTGAVGGAGIWLTRGSAYCMAGMNLFDATANHVIDHGLLNIT